MSSSSSSSPRRSRGNNGDEDRPKFFDSKAKSKCWSVAAIVSVRHPERWRKDAAKNIICKRFCYCQGCLCFEYDHIVPFSKDANLLKNYPELQELLGWVYFHSNVTEFNRVECCGPLIEDAAPTSGAHNDESDC